jgi:palmitoyltransferase ZDHHC1/11
LGGRFATDELKFCLLCDCQVQRNSYHCKRCNRCTENFDHHCRFLNNCIGSRNYEPFLRLLLTYCSYCAIAIVMGAWTASKTFRDPSLAFNGSQWGMLTVAIFSFLILLAVGALLVFHCYITCCEGTTTFSHIHERGPPNSERININVNVPGSAQRINPQDRFS